MSKTTGQIPIEFEDKKPIPSSRKGDVAEFYAVTWLWDHGYEVFVNAGCTGPIDMIAYKDGLTILIDVKTTHQDFRRDTESLRIGSKRTEKQKELGVVFLAFNPETRKLAWVKHKE